MRTTRTFILSLAHHLWEEAAVEQVKGHSPLDHSARMTFRGPLPLSRTISHCQRLVLDGSIRLPLRPSQTLMLSFRTAPLVARAVVPAAEERVQAMKPSSQMHLSLLREVTRPRMSLLQAEGRCSTLVYLAHDQGHPPHIILRIPHTLSTPRILLPCRLPRPLSTCSQVSSSLLSTLAVC